MKIWTNSWHILKIDKSKLVFVSIMIWFDCTGIVRKYDVILFIFYAIYLIIFYFILFYLILLSIFYSNKFRLILKPLWCDLTRQMTCFKLGKLRMKCLKKTYWSFLGPRSKARGQKLIGYRLFFLRSIAQYFTQIYMNCFVSS